MTGGLGVHAEVVTGRNIDSGCASRQHPGFSRVRVLDEEVQMHLHGRRRAGQVGGWKPGAVWKSTLPPGTAASPSPHQPKRLCLR